MSITIKIAVQFPKSIFYHLYFLEGLKFIKKPSNRTGIISKPIWIDCIGSGYPKPAIHYFRIKDRPGPLNETYFKEYKNGTLYIPKLRAKDQGTYMCFLKNEPGGTKSAQFHLTVQSKNKAPELTKWVFLSRVVFEIKLLHYDLFSECNETYCSSEVSFNRQICKIMDFFFKEYE